MLSCNAKSDVWTLDHSRGSHLSRRQLLNPADAALNDNDTVIAEMICKRITLQQVSFRYRLTLSRKPSAVTFLDVSSDRTTHLTTWTAQIAKTANHHTRCYFFATMFRRCAYDAVSVNLEAWERNLESLI